MCQPFAITAWSVIGTVRPATTSRGALPPTTVQRTGRNDSVSAIRTEPSDVCIPSVKKNRYASLFIQLKYIRKAARSLLCDTRWRYLVRLELPAVSSVSPPDTIRPDTHEADGTRTLLFPELVQRRADDHSLHRRICRAVHDAARFRKENAFQAERFRFRLRRCGGFRIRLDDHLEGCDARGRHCGDGHPDADPVGARRAGRPI